MEEFLSKIENFIFDILGLVLPGFIFLGILIIPLALVDIRLIADADYKKSFVLSELSAINDIFKNYWNEESTMITILIVVLAYLFGHFIKVFSIIKYEILEAVFDKSINRLVALIYTSSKNIADYTFQIFSTQSLFSTEFYKTLKNLFKPIKSTLTKIFTFRSEDYFTNNTRLRTDSIAIINSKLATNYPDEWYSLYKFSTVMTNQENIKSLAAFFLAKYNLYRSLAFIFLFAGFYFHFFFKSSTKYISPDIQKISSLILITSCLLWFTFHYKYKRYWTLCGNETLVSLYYFLNKKKINA